MIVYDLKCSHGHRFEGWFRDSAAFERQAGAGEVVCAVCGDATIAKAPMAPRLGKGKAADEAHAAKQRAEAIRMLADLRRKVEQNCDYVGDRFAEEARRIHYGETDPHGIYGEATADEARELAEEGVEVARIPWVPVSDA